MQDVDGTRIDPGNAEQARAWDENEGVYWAANADRFDRSVAPLHARLLAAASVRTTDVVLDVGCGAGRVTLDVARAANAGRAVGIDLSTPMLAEARRRAEMEGVGNVEFVRGDAQVHPFPSAAFDLALSRTGVMFFADPVAAFANIGRALRPGGRLVATVWRSLPENEWIREFSSALAAGRDRPSPPPDAPGPFSLADPDRVRRVFDAAGFEGVELEPLDEPMWFGETAAEAFDFVLGVAGWMLDGLDEDGRRRALDDLRATMEAHTTPDGVVFGSAAWLLSARGRGTS